MVVISEVSSGTVLHRHSNDYFDFIWSIHIAPSNDMFICDNWESTVAIRKAKNSKKAWLQVSRCGAVLMGAGGQAQGAHEQSALRHIHP